MSSGGWFEWPTATSVLEDSTIAASITREDVYNICQAALNNPQSIDGETLVRVYFILAASINCNSSSFSCPVYSTLRVPTQHLDNLSDTCDTFALLPRHWDKLSNHHQQIVFNLLLYCMNTSLERVRLSVVKSLLFIASVRSYAGPWPSIFATLSAYSSFFVAPSMTATASLISSCSSPLNPFLTLSLYTLLTQLHQQVSSSSSSCPFKLEQVRSWMSVDSVIQMYNDLPYLRCLTTPQLDALYKFTLLSLTFYTPPPSFASSSLPFLYPSFLYNLHQCRLCQRPSSSFSASLQLLHFAQRYQFAYSPSDALSLYTWFLQQHLFDPFPSALFCPMLVQSFQQYSYLLEDEWVVKRWLVALLLGPTAAASPTATNNTNNTNNNNSYLNPSPTHNSSNSPPPPSLLSHFLSNDVLYHFFHSLPPPVFYSVIVPILERLFDCPPVLTNKTGMLSSSTSTRISISGTTLASASSVLAGFTSPSTFSSSSSSFSSSSSSSASSSAAPSDTMIIKPRCPNFAAFDVDRFVFGIGNTTNNNNPIITADIMSLVLHSLSRLPFVSHQQLLVDSITTIVTWCMLLDEEVEQQQQQQQQHQSNSANSLSSLFSPFHSPSTLTSMSSSSSQSSLSNLLQPSASPASVWFSLTRFFSVMLIGNEPARQLTLQSIFQQFSTATRPSKSSSSALSVSSSSSSSSSSSFAEVLSSLVTSYERSTDTLAILFSKLVRESPSSSLARQELQKLVEQYAGAYTRVEDRVILTDYVVPLLFKLIEQMQQSDGDGEGGEDEEDGAGSYRHDHRDEEIESPKARRRRQQQQGSRRRQGNPHRGTSSDLERHQREQALIELTQVLMHVRAYVSEADQDRMKEAMERVQKLWPQRDTEDSEEEDEDEDGDGDS